MISVSALLSILYRTRIGDDGEASELLKEASERMEWEPTHFTGVSLTQFEAALLAYVSCFDRNKSERRRGKEMRAAEKKCGLNIR